MVGEWLFNSLII